MVKINKRPDWNKQNEILKSEAVHNNRIIDFLIWLNINPDIYRDVYNSVPPAEENLTCQCHALHISPPTSILLFYIPTHIGPSPSFCWTCETWTCPEVSRSQFTPSPHQLVCSGRHTSFVQGSPLSQIALMHSTILHVTHIYTTIQTPRAIIRRPSRALTPYVTIAITCTPRDLLMGNLHV